MLTGEKKKTYQRNYMREYMRVKRNKANKQVVKTLNIKPVKTLEYDADGNVVYDE
jgi:hypothetical protein